MVKIDTGAVRLCLVRCQVWVNAGYECDYGQDTEVTDAGRDRGLPGCASSAKLYADNQCTLVATRCVGRRYRFEDGR